MEDRKLAKGLVKRSSHRVVTPGTNLDVSGQEEGRNNFLMSIVCTEDRFGLFQPAMSLPANFSSQKSISRKKLMDEINKLSPSEIICNEALLMSGLDEGDLKGPSRHHD